MLGTYVLTTGTECQGLWRHSLVTNGVQRKRVAKMAADVKDGSPTGKESCAFITAWRHATSIDTATVRGGPAAAAAPSGSVTAPGGRCPDHTRNVERHRMWVLEFRSTEERELGEPG